jgi:hypothetical protein
METARVDICYRPLRVAWAIHSSDKDGFRRAVRLSRRNKYKSGGGRSLKQTAAMWPPRVVVKRGRNS